MRLIDADELAKIYKGWIPQLSSEEDEGDRRGVETCIAVLEDMPTVDTVSVVRCENCVLHGNCVTEDTFVLAGIYNPLCCVGKREEGADK